MKYNFAVQNQNSWHGSSTYAVTNPRSSLAPLRNIVAIVAAAAKRDIAAQAGCNAQTNPSPALFEGYFHVHEPLHVARQRRVEVGIEPAPRATRVKAHVIILQHPVQALLEWRSGRGNHRNNETGITVII